MVAPTPDQIAELLSVHSGPEATAERLARSQMFDPDRAWVDGSRRTLSDRLWRQRQEVRDQIDAVLVEAIRTGEDALITADKLEAMLRPELQPVRDASGQIVRGQRRGIVTSTPNPRFIPKSLRPFSGSFPARRLARTEISRAHFAGTAYAAERTPFARGMKWNLSGRHERADECDQNASRDVGLGPGVYPVKDFPRYPSHPGDLCFVTIETVDDIDAVVDELRRLYRLDEP